MSKMYVINCNFSDIIAYFIGAGTKSALQGQGELEARRAEPEWGSWGEGGEPLPTR